VHRLRQFRLCRGSNKLVFEWTPAALVFSRPWWTNLDVEVQPRTMGASTHRQMNYRIPRKNPGDCGGQYTETCLLERGDRGGARLGASFDAKAEWVTQVDVDNLVGSRR